MKLRHLTASVIALILMSACSDSTGLEVDDIAGAWTATAMVFTSVADPLATFDMVTEGATLSLTLGTDATYDFLFTFPMEADEIESGSYVVTGSTLALSPTGTGSPESFTIARNGDTMTLTSDDEFDFNDDQVEEPAILVLTLTR